MSNLAAPTPRRNAFFDQEASRVRNTKRATIYCKATNDKTPIANDSSASVLRWVLAGSPLTGSTDITISEATRFAPKLPDLLDKNGVAILDSSEQVKILEDVQRAVKLARNKEASADDLAAVCTMQNRIPDLCDHYSDFQVFGMESAFQQVEKHIMDIITYRSLLPREMERLWRQITGSRVSSTPMSESSTSPFFQKQELLAGFISTVYCTASKCSIGEQTDGKKATLKEINSWMRTADRADELKKLLLMVHCDMWNKNAENVKIFNGNNMTRWLERNHSEFGMGEAVEMPENKGLEWYDRFSNLEIEDDGYNWDRE